MTIAEQLPWSTLHDLLLFRAENSPVRGVWPPPTANEPQPVTDAELRDLLLFAARHAQNVQPGSATPRQVEALRVVWLVPVHLGEQLFAAGVPG